VDFLTVLMIAVFVSMVGVVHRVYTEKMLRKLMAVVVAVHVVCGAYWQNVVYVV
jgi:hypothetical protein